MTRRFLLLFALLSMVLAACSNPGTAPVVTQPDPARSTITSSRGTAALGESFTVTVQLRNTAGDPLAKAGQPITFVTSSGTLTPAALAVASTPPETVLTNGEGQASVTLTPTGPGTVTVQAFLGSDASGPALGSTSVTVAHRVVELDDLTVTYDGSTKTLVPRFYPPEASEGSTITYASGTTKLSGAPSDAGVYQVTVTAGNSFPGNATATLKIEPRALTVENVKWADKTYDGTTGASVSSATLATGNIVAGDHVKLAGPLQGAFASTAAGTHATVGRFALEGEQAHNYRIQPQPIGTASITPVAVTLADAAVTTKEYDGTIIATVSAALVGVPAQGGNVDLTGTFATAEAGTGIPVTIALAGENAGNYTLADTTLAGDITPRPLELRPNPITLALGAVLPGPVSFTADGLVAGEAIARVELTVVDAEYPYAAGTHALQVTSPVAASGTNLSNYTISTPAVPGALTVSATSTPSIVTIASRTVTYDGQPQSLTPQYSPPESSVGSTVTYVLDGVESTDPPSAAGTYTVTVTPGTGYASTITTATLTIEPRDLTVSVAWNDKQYDATTTATVNSAILAKSNIIDGDSVSLSDAWSSAFASTAIGTHAVTGNFTLVGEDASNYRINPQPTGTATIEAAELSVLDITVTTKVYDGTTAATFDVGLATVDIHGEDVSLVGAFTSANAGTGIEVAIELTGADAGNYVLADTTLTGDITPRPLELLPEPISLALGEELPDTVSFTANGLITGEKIASVELTVTDAVVPYAPGSYALQVVNPIAAYGTNLSNYNINTPEVLGALTVTAGLVTVTPMGPFAKTYGADDPAFTYSVTGADLAGMLVITREEGENVGSYDFELGDTSAWPQYQFTLADSAAFQIEPAFATIIPAADQSKTYGAADPVFEFEVTGLQFEDAATGALTRASGESAGQYGFDISSITISSNYTLQLITGAETFNIQPATLTITPDAGQTKLLGTDDPDFTFTASGFANGDTKNILTGALSRAAGEDAGTYAFNLGNLSAGTNYNLALAGDASFAVGGVAITGATVTYDGEPHTLDATFLPADAAVGSTIIYVDAAGNTLAGAPTAAGTYTVTATAGAGYAGSATAVLVIKPRSLTVSNVEFADKVYDAATGATLSARLETTNIVAGDTVRLVERLVGTFPSSQVGEYDDVVGNIELTGADASNYVIVEQPTGTAKITARPVTLQGATAANKPYDGNDEAVVSGILSGIRAADISTIGYEATFAQNNAGTGIPVAVELTGAAKDNYAFTKPALAADITPREITVAIQDLAPKTYGKGLPATVGSDFLTVTGLVAGQTITELALSIDGDAAQAAVGEHPIIASNPTGDLFNAANYAITYMVNPLQVTPLAITITGGANSWTYGDTPKTGDLNPSAAPDSEFDSMPDFAILSGTLQRTDVNVGNSAVFESDDLAIVDEDSNSILGNFTITYSTYEITPREATITVTYDETKTYGELIGPADVGSGYFTVIGLADGETIEQVTLSSDGFASSASVTEYDVTASNPTGTTFNADNYNLTFKPGTLTVTPLELTLDGSFSISEREYNNTKIAPIATPHALVLNGVLDGDDVGIDPKAVYADGTVGINKRATLTNASQLTGEDAHNYTLSLVDAPESTGTLTKATVTFDVTISGTNGKKQVVYNGSTTFQPNVTSSVSPHPADEPIAFNIEIKHDKSGINLASFRDVGTYTVAITANDPRYAGTSVHTDLEVLARKIIIASANNSKTYGDGNPDLAPSIASTSDNPLGTGDYFKVDTELAYEGSDELYLDAGTYAFNLGTVEILRGGSDVTGNYSITFEDEFEVEARMLIITPDADQAKVYGNDDPVFKYTATGFVGSDDASLLDGALTRNEGEAVESYPYQLGSLSAGTNYSLSFTPDIGPLAVATPVFTITPRPITLTATTTTRIYGDPVADLTALAADGSLALRDGDTLRGSLNMPNTNAGTATFTADDSAILRDDVDVTSNYTITYATYTITKRSATVLPTADQSKTYGDKDPSFAYTIEGLLEGDDNDLEGALERVAGENVGTYGITIGTLTNPNYDLSLPEDAVTFAITKRPVTLGVAYPAKEYGDNNPNLAPVLIDGTLRDDDAFSGSLTYTGTNANTYNLTIGDAKILHDGSDVTSNYDISFSTFTIQPKPVTFDITNSDLMLEDANSSTHVFLGDGITEVRGLTVTSDPAGVDSFSFTYRRTFNELHEPIPHFQQTVQNINKLGSYTVTIIPTDPNYTGLTTLNVWVTDQIGLAADSPLNAYTGLWSTVSIPLVNQAGNFRALGPVGISFDLTTDTATTQFANMANEPITTLTVPAGADSVTFQVKFGAFNPAVSIVTLTPITPEADEVIPELAVGFRTYAKVAFPADSVVGVQGIPTETSVQLRDYSDEPIHTVGTIELSLSDSDEGLEFLSSGNEPIESISIAAGFGQSSFSIHSTSPGEYQLRASAVELTEVLAVPDSQSVTIKSLPEITELDPASLVIGTTTEMKIIGAGFEPEAEVVLPNGLSAEVLEIEPGVITVNVTVDDSAGLQGLQQVQVKNPDGGISIPRGFHVVLPPFIIDPLTIKLVAVPGDSDTFRHAFSWIEQQAADSSGLDVEFAGCEYGVVQHHYMNLTGCSGGSVAGAFIYNPPYAPTITYNLRDRYGRTGYLTVTWDIKWNLPG